MRYDGKAMTTFPTNKLALIRSASPVLRAKFGVRELAVFGSYARCDEQAGSDIDVLVSFEGPADFDRFMGLKFHLEDLLGSKVDLVTRAALRPELRERILAEAVSVA